MRKIRGKIVKNERFEWLWQARQFLKRIMRETTFRKVLEMTNLQCRKCGQCCVKFEIPELEKKENERCKYLTEDNLCSIYADRPKICRDFPKIDDYDYVCEHSIDLNVKAEVCPILEEFWRNVYNEMRGGEKR